MEFEGRQTASPDDPSVIEQRMIAAYRQGKLRLLLRNYELFALNSNGTSFSTNLPEDFLSLLNAVQNNQPVDLRTLTATATFISSVVATKQ